MVCVIFENVKQNFDSPGAIHFNACCDARIIVLFWKVFFSLLALLVWMSPSQQFSQPMANVFHLFMSNVYSSIVLLMALVRHV